MAACLNNIVQIVVFKTFCFVSWLQYLHASALFHVLWSTSFSFVFHQSFTPAFSHLSVAVCVQIYLFSLSIVSVCHWTAHGEMHICALAATPFVPQPFLLLNVTRALLIQPNNPRVGKLSFSCTGCFIHLGFRNNKTERETPLRTQSGSLFFCCDSFESRVQTTACFLFMKFVFLTKTAAQTDGPSSQGLEASCSL